MYDFRTLSPLDFEELVRDLLQAELNLRLESFGPGTDLGIDFRFAVGDGKAIVQAKHYIDSSSDALVRAAKHENEKIAKLAPSRYIFATSASLTPQLKVRILEAMPSAPLTDQDILGRADLNNLLGLHSKIEKQHFKLWLASTAVLERILHSGVYNRTQAEMEMIKALVPKFVHNQSVPHAEEILKKCNALIIAGEPGVGKSTLARILVWLHAEQNWKISVIDDIKEAFEIVTEDDRHLIFFDDFLGQVRLSPDLIRGMDQRFPPFLQKVRTSKNLRFVLTTRDYILHQAQAQSSRLSAPMVSAAEFILNVGTYTRATKARMLFNHLYFSDVSAEERNELLRDDFFLKIIDHRNFNPRLVDLLTSADYVSISGLPIRDAVASVLENPHELWEKPYRAHISDEGRALMLALFLNAQRCSIDGLEHTFIHIARALEMPLSQADGPVKFRGALKELEGSVFAIQDRVVTFSNPGVRDFLQRVIVQDKIIDVMVDVVAEYVEVDQAWSLFRSQHVTQKSKAAIARKWALAAMRLLGSDSGSALKRMCLIVDMYDYLQAEDLLEPVRAATIGLAEAGIESYQTDAAKEALEQLCVSLLPLGILEEAQGVLSTAVATLLADYGGELSMEDIESLSDSFVRYGVDSEAAKEAARAGLEAYVDNVRENLSEIQSLDELDSYERDLNRLMMQYNVFGVLVDTRIENRREQLAEREARDHSEERYGSRARTSFGDISDAQVRSMFGGLRRD